MEASKSREEALKQLKQLSADTFVFTDGSVHGNKVGASAILQRKGQQDRKLQLHLGSADHHTVYEAELVGLILASHLIQTNNSQIQQAVIVADNQAALKAMEWNRQGPGSYLVKILAETMKKAKSKHNQLKIQLTW